MQPWFWGHVFDSRATRENSSKHTNLHFLLPSAPGGEEDSGRASESCGLPPPPGSTRAREGRTDLAAMLK